MTVTVNKTVKAEVELESDFPLFRYSAPHYYKIISLTYAVIVIASKHSTERSIQTTNTEVIISDAIFKGAVIPENEFIDVYVKAVHVINQVVNAPASLAEMDLKQAS